MPVIGLAPVIAVRDSIGLGGRHELLIGGTLVELALDVPFMRVDGETIPLAVAPRQRDGVLLVPYEVFAEMLPHVTPSRWVYDPPNRQLTLVAPGERPPIVAVADVAVTKKGSATRPGVRSIAAASWWTRGMAASMAACTAPLARIGRCTRRTSRSPWPRSSPPTCATAAWT